LTSKDFCNSSPWLTNQKTAGVMEKKKKRAASEDIARIALEDVVKCFGLPIVEASRNLKVGLTVLKRKCRELGIPRWPHRKIKSLTVSFVVSRLPLYSLFQNILFHCTTCK
jgi:DNA-binding NtrC family response regulator